MRIPSNKGDELSVMLNEIHARISKVYLDHIKRFMHERIDVMLSDGTIIQQETFNLEYIKSFLKRLQDKLQWDNDGIHITATDDLRRLHTKFSCKIKRYELNCYLAVQYHALLFYRCDEDVVRMKKEISELEEKIISLKPMIEEKKNHVIEDEMKKKGINDLEIQDMLALLYNDEKTFAELENKAKDIEAMFPEYSVAIERKQELLNKLNSMIIEVYRIKPSLIDYMALMQGEEGVAIYFDLEGGTKFSAESIKSIIEKLSEVEQAMNTITA